MHRTNSIYLQGRIMGPPTTAQRSHGWPPSGSTLMVRREILSPIQVLAAMQILGVGNTDFDEARVHDVFTMRRTRKPAVRHFRGGHDAGGNVLANDAMFSVSCAFDALRRRAAIVAAMIERC